jgi:hypothetical protein
MVGIGRDVKTKIKYLAIRDTILGGNLGTPY